MATAKRMSTASKYLESGQPSLSAKLAHASVFAGESMGSTSTSDASSPALTGRCRPAIVPLESRRPETPLNPAGSAAQHGVDVIGDQFARNVLARREHAVKLHRIISMLSRQELHMVYQPAIRLDRAGVEFVEALARFEVEPYESPDHWFRIAAEVDLGVELEMLAVRLALEGLHSLPSALSLSINVSPNTLISTALNEALSSVPLDRIILEVTEHEPVRCYATVRRHLEHLRGRGLRLAVDDAGAGYSNFRHILELQPDIVKLDMSLTRGITANSAKRALAAALINFAREIGSELVAEGVESFSELRTLRELGVTIVQGHIIGRPGSCVDISRWQ